MNAYATPGVLAPPRRDPGGPANALEPAYRRLVLRLEAQAANSSGAQKGWVHRAHAEALRHLGCATRSGG